MDEDVSPIKKWCLLEGKLNGEAISEPRSRAWEKPN